MNTTKQLQEYEKLFETEPIPALKKMVDLFPLPDPYDAENFDSILLWMYHEGTKEIANYIRERIKRDINNKFLYQILLDTIINRFEIHFRPRPVEKIEPVGQEPNQYLSWFFLTDGELWITAGENTLYEYTPEAIEKFGLDTSPYNEYYQARFLEDFTGLFPFISKSLPEDLYHLTENRSVFKEDIDLNEYDWINDRTMDSGHLTGGPLLSFFRHKDKIRICWEAEYQTEKGFNLWTVGNGEIEILYTDFISTVKWFGKHFFELMDHQIETAIQKDWDNITVNKEQLIKEHKERKEVFNKSFNLLNQIS